MKKKSPGPAITIYHFCAARDVRSIMEYGLSRGMTPIEKDGLVALLPWTQWLTTDKDPAHQSWNANNLVPYSRTAYRLTIRIPYSHRKKLIKATDFVKKLPPDNMGLMDWPGSENWYVYIGGIPPMWIVGVKKTEETTGGIEK